VKRTRLNTRPERKDIAELPATLLARMRGALSFGLYATSGLFILLLAACFKASAWTVPLLIVFLLVGIPTVLLMLADHFLRLAVYLRRIVAWLTRQERR
jgi:hypothetical protein